MKKQVYVETTVVSYFIARPSRDLLIAGHQETTREVWPKLAAECDTYVSALVYEEAGRGDSEQAKMRLAAIKPFRMLDIDDEARTLAERIIAGSRSYSSSTIARVKSAYCPPGVPGTSGVFACACTNRTVRFIAL